MGLFKSITKAVSHAVTAPLKHAEVAVAAVASGKPQNIFKDEFKQLKKDVKEQAKDLTAVGKDVTHVATKAIRFQSALDSKLVGGVAKAFGNGYIGDKLGMVSRHMKEDGEQLAGAMDDTADGQARLAEEGKFFDLSAQNTERKRINNNWVKDRVVYDKDGKPHVIKGLGGKAATALSVASIFLPVLAPFAAAANAANAANNGNWRGAALAAISYFAPGVQAEISSAFNASESAVGQALANAAAKGLINGASTAVMGGKFEQGFLNGAASSVAGSIAGGVMTEIAPHLDGLPPQIQTAIKNSIQTTINNAVTGKHNGASVGDQLLNGLAGYLGSEAGQAMGLNTATSQMLARVAGQYATGNGQKVDLTTVAATLFKDPAIAKAFEAMLNKGIETVRGGAAGDSEAVKRDMLGAALPHLPEEEVTAAPPLPPQDQDFTVAGQAPEIADTAVYDA